MRPRRCCSAVSWRSTPGGDSSSRARSCHPCRMSDPRYPVGPFEPRHTLTPDERRKLIGEIGAAPQRLREAVRGLGEDKLNTPYREGGWMVRQVVHHLPDSHMNAFIRLKLALTEDEPVITPYQQERWAMLPDVKLTDRDVAHAARITS